MARPCETWPSLVALVLMRVCFGIIFIVLACFSASIALLSYVTVSLFDSVLYANDCVQRAKEAGYQTLGTLLLQSMSWVLGYQQAYGLSGMLQRLALWVCHAMLLTVILSHYWLPFFAWSILPDVLKYACPHRDVLSSLAQSC